MEMGIVEKLMVLYTELHLWEPDIFPNLPESKWDFPAEPKILLCIAISGKFSELCLLSQIEIFKQEPDIGTF